MTSSSPTSTDIRRQFIDYFVEKAGHRFVPSSPVVPHGDPTLLFANAGMNQFKPYFLGTEQPDHPRAANTQKCIRAGGKHNDLEDVGRDTYHHTFFEMLGNWSFGDYFKKEAIDWAWDLLTNVWGLEPDRLHATYFEGDASEGLEPDSEARELWLRYLPTERIHPGNKKDNFWEMGDTGPCGPCSEIHYDGTPDKNGGALVNQDDPNVIEIWNLVFIQFNRGADSKLSSLPAKHVDTGMGFERITRILQGKDSNYDTDVFMPLFSAIQKVTGARAYQPGGSGDALADPINVAYRVIADHIRCLTFALTDGAVPSNEGRGYVLRRILRRAVRYGRQTLGREEPFLYDLVDGVVSHMGEAFPELKKNPEQVKELIREEEESFGRTLDRGIALFEQAAKQAEASKQIAGADAFTLYDTYGFPIDLTQLMAEERGMTVDMKGYEHEMEQARERSRGEGGGTDLAQQLVDIVQQDSPHATDFLGYDGPEAAVETTLKLYDLSEEQVLLAGATPFYAEAGGQISDIGAITWPGGRFEVTAMRKVGDVYFHLGVLKEGVVPEGKTEVTFKVDSARRAKIMANHTSTHVMNKALRDLVNPDADQKGSLVDDEKLRFDFSNRSALTVEQVEAVEQQVNRDIAADLPVYTGEAPQEEAVKISGLRAVFGEKYPPKVRVVSIGVPVEDLIRTPEKEDWKEFSIEFCGGTHLPSTGDAEGFVIISEDAVAKGVRRITAITGEAAHKAQAEAEALLNRVGMLKDAPPDELATKAEEVNRAVGEQPLPLVVKTKIRAGLDDLAKRVKDYQKAEGDKATEVVIEVARAVAEEKSGKVVCARIGGADGKTIRTAMDVIRKKHPAAALLLAGDGGGKVALVASVPDDLVKAGLKAGDWIKEVAPIVGGGGGGKPNMAQAGGKDPEKIDDALARGETFAAEKLG